MAVDGAHVFPDFSHTSTNTFFLFPKPPTTFLACFCRGERRKYAGKKVLECISIDSAKFRRTQLNRSALSCAEIDGNADLFHRVHQ